MNEIRQLYELQKVDNELDGIKQRLNAVLKAQQTDAALLQARTRAAAGAEALAKAKAQQRLHEGALTALHAESKQAETRLYSGKIKNPKELADLQLKIAALGRHRGTVEDEILEAMLLVEAAQAEAGAATAELDALESEWAETLVKLKAEQATLTAKAQALLADRDRLLPPIEKALLHEYNALSQRRGGVAVVLVKNGICQGCQVRIPAGPLSQAHKGQRVYCPSCNRILLSEPN